MATYRSKMKRPEWLDTFPQDWVSNSGNLRRVKGTFQRKRNGVWVDIPDLWAFQVPQGPHKHRVPVNRRTRSSKKKIKR